MLSDHRYDIRVRETCTARQVIMEAKICQQGCITRTLQGHSTDVTRTLQGSYKAVTQKLRGPYCQILINFYSNISKLCHNLQNTYRRNPGMSFSQNQRNKITTSRAGMGGIGV